jgi:peptidyl-prolyl cis-trans isomerase SurA
MFKKIILLALVWSVSCGEPVVLNSIVATVNNEAITADQLDEQVALARRQMVAQHITPPAMTVLQRQVLEGMINQNLQLQIAKRAHIQVTPREVDEAITQMAKMQHISSQQLLEAVSKEGISLADFRRQLANQIIIGQLQRAVISPQITVSPAEITAYIRSIKKQNRAMLYHIEDLLIPLPSAPSPDEIKAATTRANHLIAELKAGTDFKTLAAAVSKGEEALQGGDLGWHSLAELPAVFSKAIENLQVGGVTQPLRAADGLHLISLLGVRAAPTQAMNAEETRQDTANKLFKRKFEERLILWLKQAHDTAYIKIFLSGEKKSDVDSKSEIELKNG